MLSVESQSDDVLGTKEIPPPEEVAAILPEVVQSGKRHLSVILKVLEMGREFINLYSKRYIYIYRISYNMNELENGREFLNL